MHGELVNSGLLALLFEGETEQDVVYQLGRCLDFFYRKSEVNITFRRSPLRMVLVRWEICSDFQSVLHWRSLNRNKVP